MEIFGVMRCKRWSEDAILRTVAWDGKRFRGETVAACLKPGTMVELKEVCVTAETYGR